MKRLSGRQAGFTILETMIFLIVSGALISSALVLFSTRINRTQFNQSIQELDARIKGAINEVATGTYPPSPFFNCAPDGTGIPVVTTAPDNAQGANSGCIFVGKVLQFGVAGVNGCTSSNVTKCSDFYTYTMVGRRVQAGGGEVTGLTSNATGAYPRLVANVTAPCTQNGTTVDLTKCEKISGGAYVYNVKNKSTNSQTGAVAVTQSVASYTTGGGVSRLNSGAQILQSWPVATTYPRNPTQISTAVATSSTFSPANVDPAGGIVVCLRGSASQKASITIGDNDGRISTTIFMGDDPACS